MQFLLDWNKTGIVGKIKDLTVIVCEILGEKQFALERAMTLNQ